MNESARYRVHSRTLPFRCLVAAICGVMACSEDANLGKGPNGPSESGSDAGGDTNAGGVVASAGTGGTPPSTSGGAAGTSSQAGSGGTLDTAGSGSGGTGEIAGDAGALGSGGSGDGNGVILTAAYLAGSGVVRAKWHNDTDATIFLRGCATTDGWYREGDEWKKYGAFAVCANEGLEVEVAAGATYEDPAGGVPPARGDNVWQLVGPYGTGCTPGVKFSEANCGTLLEATSVNEITTQ